MKKHKGIIPFLAFAAIALFLWWLQNYAHVVLPGISFGLGSTHHGYFLDTITRWLAIFAFIYYAVVRRSLTIWIVAGMLFGIEAGHDFPAAAANLQVLSTIFLHLVKVIIAPLIFSTLVVGIANHPDLKQVGRMGIKALLYFELVTTVALFIGLGAANLTKAGVGVSPPANAASAASAVNAVPQKWTEILLHVFPENIAKSIAEGQILQVVVFSILFGVALSMVREEKRRPMLAFCESLSETMFKFTNIVMLFAPVGVAGAMAYTVGTMGFGVIGNLLKLLLTLYGALIAFVLCALVPVALLARVPLERFARAVAEPFSIAFATATSEAALPRAMENMEALGVPKKIVAFVIPTGYSFNLDGSTLYLSLAAMFVAEAAGIPLTFGQQLFMVFTLMVTSKGVAGIPRSSLVILMGTLDSFHLPAWPVLVILGVDQFMDMGRTAINVLGNCLATVVIARWEGEFRETPPVRTEALAPAEQV
jgi:proton glutamate symport protein